MRLVILFILLSLGANAQIIRANPFYVPQPSSVTFLLDAYPNAAAAYSLRKLKSSYSGSAIRVRRSNDNAEQDIGFIGQDLDTASMKTFVGTTSTDTGYIAKWYDQSGNTNNASQSTATQQPRIITSGLLEKQGSYPIIKFDGINDWLSFSNITGQNDFSIFLIQKRRVTSIRGPMVSFSGTGDGVLFAQWNDNKIYLQRASSSTQFKYKSATETGANFILLNGIIESGVYYIYKNTTVYSLSTEVTFNSTNNNFNSIGKWSNIGYSDGTLSEMIFYSSSQSSNRTGIETNINNYYGIW